MKPEEHNLKEEIKEAVVYALKSGIDNDKCAVFRVVRQDNFSPKGKAIMIDEGFYEKVLYRCNLCRGCDNSIAGTKLCDAFQKARQVLVLQGKEVEVNKEMIENLEKTGNVYGL